MSEQPTPRMTALKESFGNNGNTDFECYDKLFEAGCALEIELVQKEEKIQILECKLESCYHRDRVETSYLEQIRSLQSERDKLQQENELLKSKLQIARSTETTRIALSLCEEERDKLRNALALLEVNACHHHDCYNPPENPRAACTLKYECSPCCEIRIIKEALNHSKSPTQ